MNVLDVLSLPQFNFAHTYSADRYQAAFTKQETFIEILYLEEGSLTIEIEGDVYTAYRNDVVCLLHEEATRVSADQLHCHHTVGVNVLWQFSRENMAGLRLPTMIPAQYGTETIRRMIDDFIYRQDFFRASNARFAAKYLDMLGEIDKCVRKATPPKRPNETLYTEQAKEYIRQNIFQSISQTAIAEHLGISAGYLCSVFKNTEGITVMKYINKMKLESVKALMKKERIPLYEAAAIYGYSDPNYVSKLYKRMFGHPITQKSE